MNDVQLSEFISLRAAARLPELRRDGAAPHLSTLWRWAHKGCGEAKLRVWRVGGRWLTTHNAVREFIGATSQTPLPAHVDSDADARLAAAGY